MQNVLYLHGFLSSPDSVKAQQTRAFFEIHRPDVQLYVPAMPNYPSELESFLLSYLNQRLQLIEGGLKVIGSSMGGYLATWLVEKFTGKAVLVNPAVRPYELLAHGLGHYVHPYTKDTFELVADDMEILRTLDTLKIKHPASYQVLLQTGDAILDYRQAQEKYQNSTLIIERGGDHSFVNYDRHLPNIAAFLCGGGQEG